MKVKGRRLHLRRKMKENNGKLKKIEASLMKRLMRISWYLFSILTFCQLNFGALSLTLGHLRVFLENFNIRSRKEKKQRGRKI